MLLSNPLGSLPSARGSRALFSRFPRLDKSLPYVGLAQLPTPVTEVESLARELGLASLWIKRDDVCAEAYGGNKVRKLEFLIADAMRQGRSFLTTYGGTGSHHCLATALFGTRFGFGTKVFQLPQPVTEHVRRNLRALRATGAEMTLASTLPKVPAMLAKAKLKAWLDGTDSTEYTIPLGGSSPRGTMGYVNAALELAQQVEAGELPEPDAIVVALGSGGTLVGLQIGLTVAGLKSELVGVRVVDRMVGSATRIHHLVKKTLKFMADHGASVDRNRVMNHPTRILHDHYGEAYGMPTPGGMAAVRVLRDAASVELEQTYSGKAFAGLLAEARKPGGLSGRHVLFWNTYNGRSIDRLVEAMPWNRLPAPYHPIFEGPTTISS